MENTLFLVLNHTNTIILFGLGKSKLSKETQTLDFLCPKTNSQEDFVAGYVCESLKLNFNNL